MQWEWRHLLLQIHKTLSITLHVLRFVLRMNLLVHVTKHWTEKLTNNRNQPLTTTTSWGLTQEGIFLHNLPGDTQNAWVCSRNRKHSSEFKPLWYANLYNLTGPGPAGPPLPHSTPRLPFIHSSIHHPIVHSFIRSPYQLVWCGTLVTKSHLIVSWCICQAFLQVWQTHWWLHVFKVASWRVCGENAAVEIRTSKFYHPIQLPWQSSPARDVWQIKS